jgi:uncharacterized membrane protein
MAVNTPCTYTIEDLDPSAEYHLSEITTTEFELMDPRDINDRGQIVGTGQTGPGRPQDVSWSYSNGQVNRLDFVGTISALSNTGQVVAAIHEAGFQHVALYQQSSLTDLPLYHGEPGVFAGSDASASAINSRGLIAGEVISKAEERGRPNKRAALFQLGQPTLALMELAANFGSNAIDINERGQVLVVANPAVFDARSVLWEPTDGAWANVGDNTTNVFPIAMTDQGIVLGQGRNARNQPVAVICKPDGRWERLGTEDGWIPVDINNKGEVVGRVMIDRLECPWLHRPTGQTILLPYISNHHTTPKAINNLGQIVGSAGADHGSHVLLWST